MAPSYNAADDLRRWASERPDAPALRFPAAGYRTEAPAWDSWTFRELDRMSDAFARGFVAHGVARGDRALVLIKPSLDFYAVLFGLFKLGAVPVILDPGMGPRALLACIGRTRAPVVVGAPAVHAVRQVARASFAGTRIAITAGRRWFWGGPTLEACRQPDDSPFPLARMDAHEDAAILFTSGSTGTAKGVASKQAMFRAQVDSLREMFGFEPGMTDAQAFAGFAIFDLCLGLTSVIHHMDLSKPASARPEDIAATFEAWQPEIAFASPIVWQNLSRWALARGATFPSIRTAITVGAPIPAYLHRRYRQILAPGARMSTPYGATEGLPVSVIDTDEILGETGARTAAGHGTCVGSPAPGCTVHVVGITEDPIPVWRDDLALPPGEIGEIVAGGRQISPEYKDAPEANALAKIHRGDEVLHRMGDLGYLDDRGRLWFCGRKAHRLETAAGMIPADPVEAVYDEHPDVFRTALVGVGPRGAEVPVLCVELEPGRTWSPALEQALGALADGTRWRGVVRRMLPHHGFPTDPRHNSKIRRELLKGWAEARCPELVGGGR